MNYFLKFYIYIFVLLACGQGIGQEISNMPATTDQYASIVQSQQDRISAFEKAAAKHAILQKTLTNVPAVKNGYYIISGVFENDDQLPKQVRQFKQQGFDSGYFKNPNTQMFYVFLNHYDSWEKAFKDCTTKFDNRYTKEVWVLNIAQNVPAAKMVSLKDIHSQTINNSEKENANDLVNQLKIQNKEPGSKSTLIKKADELFSKMWYAEAATYYELALTMYKNDYSYELLQKAGDAHYFNSDMQQAYKWYHMAFEKFEKEMSADFLFKYAHTLKGIGNYGRSKKLMRLYTRKLNGQFHTDKSEENEILLDAILGLKEQFNIKNLSINSPNADFSPMYYSKDELVYTSSRDSSVFNTRNYKWNNQPYLDLYVAKLSTESQELKYTGKFSKKINTKYHEASATFSPDQSTMYFTRNNYGKKLRRDSNGINNLKIYRSQKINGEWQEATELPFNSDEYSTGHPALSPDGRQLYFVSDMPGSIGETDIFVVDVLKDGLYSSPRNLGPEINTEQKEMFPFISDKKLYFSSNGHVGLGGLDVFEVAFDQEDGFLEVRNVGKPVNSKNDDFSFIIDEETQKGYFASNRTGGKGDDDIYAFKKLEIEETPANKNAIAGMVTELISGNVMPNALVQLFDENNIKLKEMETADDGSFIFEDLESDTHYYLKTTKDSYYENEHEATTGQNELVSVDFSMRKLNDMIQVENGIRKLKTEMIHFNFDQSFIREDAASELDKLVTVMKESPSMIIKIESHTDSRGAAAYNKYLSDRRAKSTRDYLISQGIAPERIESAVGYGEEQLLNACDGSLQCTEEQHYLNRRSEFVIVSM